MYKRVFDIHAWKLSTHAFNEGDIRLYESLTSIGNGYMGMRGNFEEGFSGDSHTGTYIAGIWFPDKTRVGWWKNGYPKYFGKVINAVNFAAIGVEINGKTVDLHTSNFSDYYEELDMRSGLLTRSYTVDSVKLTFRRFFSIVERRTAEFQLIIEGKANVKLTSALDGNVKNLDSNYDERFWDIVDGTENYLSMRTKENPFGTPRFTVSAGMKKTLSVKAKRNSGVGSGYVYECFDFGLGEGEKVVFENNKHTPCIAQLLTSNRSGVIKKIYLPSDIKALDVSYSFDYKVGDQVNQFVLGPDRVGQVIASGKTLQDAQERLLKAKNMIEIEVQ